MYMYIYIYIYMYIPRSRRTTARRPPPCGPARSTPCPSCCSAAVAASAPLKRGNPLRLTFAHLLFLPSGILY